MLYFIYGHDSFLLKEALDELIFNLKQKNKERETEIKKINLEKEDPGNFFLELGNLELFSKFKIFIIEKAFKNSGAESWLKKIIGKNYLSPQSQVLIVLEESVPKKNSKLFNFLLKNSEAKECRPLEGKEIFRLAKKELKKYGAEFQASALGELVLRTRGDLWRLRKEIQKLASASKNRSICRKDVILHVRKDEDANIFETISALASKQRAKAIDLISQHLEKGQDPLYLFSMVVYQFRTLLQIKDFLDRGFTFFDIQKKTGLHPFVIKKSLAFSQSFSKEKLFRIYRHLSRLDFQIKIGKLRPETALELFVAGITQG